MTQTLNQFDLASDYALSEDTILGYREKGHAVVRSLLTPEEIQEFGPIITSASDRFNVETRPLAERDTYGKAFLQTTNLWERDEQVRRYTLARRFAKVAAELMGVPAVRLYHDQALFKEPGGGLTPWHQDQFYWPLDTSNTITLWMPLVDIPAEVGGMVFGSGSHKLGYIGELAISDTSNAVLGDLIEQQGIPKESYGAMSAGDATFHAGWTLHSAPGNPTSKMRSVMTVIYFADGTRAKEPMNENQKNDLAGWLPGIQPGELAASPLNPLVYPA
jgi:ectoine hydroxylase-related dioxygenase (phytanoyl-CoA dioxygenase family)